jgi:hypothetical protein
MLPSTSKKKKKKKKTKNKNKKKKNKTKKKKKKKRITSKMDSIFIKTNYVIDLVECIIKKDTRHFN